VRHRESQEGIVPFSGCMQPGALTIPPDRRGFLQALPSAFIQRGVAAPTQGRRLYLLSGSSWPIGELLFPAVLFALDDSWRGIDWASTLIGDKAGLAYVLYSHEGRFLITAGPAWVRSDWVVVSFDKPGAPRIFRTDPGPATILNPHLVAMSGEPWLTLQFSAEKQRRLLAVRLSTFETREVTPESAYQNFLIDGAAGGGFPRTEFAFLEQPPDSRRLVVAEWMPPRFPSPIEVPEFVRFPDGDLISLSAANSRILALTSKETTIWKGVEGYTAVWLLDRNRNSWHSVRVPGVSRLRAFGEWLVAHVVYNLREKPKRGEVWVRESSGDLPLSPGSAQRLNGRTPTGLGFDALMDDLEMLQPGLLWLYHVPSKRLIFEETGQGDTEVLLVEDARVLYRCAQTLYAARIEGTRLVGRRRLIERDFIRDVHWVFYGPPAAPPPAPQYPPFRAYER